MRLSYGAVLACGTLLGLAASASAQVFLGKNTQGWLQELDRSEVPVRRNAAYALGKLGGQAAPAVPALLGRLRDESPKVREAAAYALGEIGQHGISDPGLVVALAGALKDEDYLVRRSAAYGLGSLGRNAAPAVGALVDALNDSKGEVKQNAAWALGKIGEAGVPGIRKALGDADSLVKRDAAAALAPLDPKVSRPALGELLPLCRDPNTETRKAAVIVLVKIVAPEDTAALAPLRPLLDAGEDPEVRANAALALSNIGGKDAAAAVPALLDALRRGDAELRRQAAAAIRNIGPDAKDAVPDLIKALADPDGETRANAALALGGIGPGAEAAVGALVGVIASAQEKSPTRIEAAVALSRIGPAPAAEEAVPVLLKVLEDPAQDARVRERIVWSLRVHKGHLRTLPGIYPTFAKILTEARTEDNRMLRYDCAYMLGVLRGPEVPPEAMGVLLEFLKDDTIQIFDNKKSSVGGTGQETATGKANVKEIGKGDGRVMAIQALTQIGRARLKQSPDILRQLQALADDQAVFSDLREGCKKLLKSVK
jgi:HEAT repeat protein